MTLEEKIEQNLKKLHIKIENRMKVIDKKFQQEMYQKCIDEFDKKEYEIRKVLGLPISKVEKELDILLERFPKQDDNSKKETKQMKIVHRLLYATIVNLLLVWKSIIPKESDSIELVVPQIKNYFDQGMDITERANKLVEAMEQNDKITEEEFLIFEQLEGYLEDNIYMDYVDVYQTLTNLDVTYTLEQPADEIVFTLAEYYASVPEIAVYKMGWNRKSEILPHEYVHMTGRLFDYPELSEGITELIAREYCTEGKLLGYYPKNVTCVRLLCELIDPQIILEAYSTHNSNLIVEALVFNFPSKNLSYFATCLLDQMENYCASTQIDDFEYYKGNLNSIITFYTKVCGMEQLSPYFEQYMSYLINYYTTVPNENIRFYFNLDTTLLEKEQSQKRLKNEQLYYI